MSLTRKCNAKKESIAWWDKQGNKTPADRNNKVTESVKMIDVVVFWLLQSFTPIFTSFSPNTLSRTFHKWSKLEYFWGRMDAVMKTSIWISCESYHKVFHLQRTRREADRLSNKIYVWKLSIYKYKKKEQNLTHSVRLMHQNGQTTNRSTLHTWHPEADTTTNSFSS